MNIDLRHIKLPLPGFTLEVDITLSSRMTVLSGPSGSGKTSLLDLIAGLRRCPSAFIRVGGQVLADTSNGVCLAARERHIGYVPQDLALFPHISVRNNILYGHKPGQVADHGGLFGYAHVTGVLEIGSLAERGVARLSGGEMRRVALARALMSSPRMLLLDEPLANLDRALKARILPYLLRIRDEFRLPMIYVSHDREEIEPLCGTVVELERGRVTRVST